MAKDSVDALSNPKGKKAILGKWNLSGSTLAALVAFAGTGAFVLVPRPTFPRTIPLPDVDARAAVEFERTQYARALRVKDGSLTPSIRAVGEQVRRLGALSAQKKALPSDRLNQLRADARNLADSKEVEALLDLRALQTELFIHSLKEQQKTGKMNQDVFELGGAFHWRAHGTWLSQNGRLRVSINGIRVLFRAHWTRLVGLHSHDRFRMSLAEARRYYAINVMHPQSHPRDQHSSAMAQIQLARALGRVDPSYPTSLAVGILRLQLGQPREAARALQDFLSARPSGNWTGVARNHLMTALLQSSALAE